MKLGCLIRGGIATGSLYHAKGVVYGPALLEAYELESQFAQQPRIILSEETVRIIGDNPYIVPDGDGFSVLDYTRAAYDMVPFGPTGTEVEMASKRAWIATVGQQCNEQIGALRKVGNLAGRRHWQWFLYRFNQFVVVLHPSITCEGR